MDVNSKGFAKMEYPELPRNAWQEVENPFQEN